MAKKNEAPAAAAPTVEERIVAAIELLAANVAANTALIQKIENAVGMLLSAVDEAAMKAAAGMAAGASPVAAVAAEPGTAPETPAPAPTPADEAPKATDAKSEKPADVKPNGKKATPEELEDEMKKLVVELAQKSGREAVVKILSAFGVQRASEVPVAKLPEFVAALRTAVAKAS